MTLIVFKLKTANINFRYLSNSQATNAQASIKKIKKREYDWEIGKEISLGFKFNIKEIYIYILKPTK